MKVLSILSSPLNESRLPSSSLLIVLLFAGVMLVASFLFLVTKVIVIMTIDHLDWFLLDLSGLIRDRWIGSSHCCSGSSVGRRK